MANDLVGSPGAKPLVALALDLRGWELAEQRDGDPDEAIAIIDRYMVPMKETAEGLSGEGARRLVNPLRMIGAKIAPNMSEEQVNVWLSAMVAALSDLPARVSIRAAEEAIHVPMKFINEAEGAIREKAASVRSRYDLARNRLLRMKREIERAARPQPQLPPPMALSEQDLQTMPEALRSLGLKGGWLEEDAEGRLSWKKEDAQ